MSYTGWKMVYRRSRVISRHRSSVRPSELPAASYITEAKQLAERTGDTTTFSLFFGPTNVRIWEISIEADGGEPGRAVALARQTEPSRVAERLAPAHVRADPLVWETTRDIVERRQRGAVSPEVRAFCGRLGVAL
jgi:hypothetical protein